MLINSDVISIKHVWISTGWWKFSLNARCSMGPSRTRPHVAYSTGVPYSVTSILLYQRRSAPDSQARSVSLIVYPLSSAVLFEYACRVLILPRMCMERQREREKEGSKQNWFKLDDAQSGVNLVSRLDLIRSVFRNFCVQCIRGGFNDAIHFHLQSVAEA